jgi:hypothetical protein
MQYNLLQVNLIYVQMNHVDLIVVADLHQLLF